ncbi:MAG: hypothetical protein ACLR6J_11680 [Parabacteroides merdae]
MFDLEASEAKAAIDKVPLPFIPGKEEDTEENELFKSKALNAPAYDYGA